METDRGFCDGQKLPSNNAVRAISGILSSLRPFHRSSIVVVCEGALIQKCSYGYGSIWSCEACNLSGVYYISVLLFGLNTMPGLKNSARPFPVLR